jgi:hypothetical protein
MYTYIYKYNGSTHTHTHTCTHTHVYDTLLVQKYTCWAVRLRVRDLTKLLGTQFTCFTGTKVQILTYKVLKKCLGSAPKIELVCDTRYKFVLSLMLVVDTKKSNATGTQFTCFTGTKKKRYSVYKRKNQMSQKRTSWTSFFKTSSCLRRWKRYDYLFYWYKSTNTDAEESDKDSSPWRRGSGWGQESYDDF